MLNTIILHGRLTAKPELKTTQNGNAVTSFTLAVPRDYKGKDGQEVTDFIDCVAWRQTAEFAVKYFDKGSAAIVKGSVETRSYEDKNGNKRKAVEVKVDNLYFGETKKRDGNNEADTAGEIPNLAPTFRDLPDVEVEPEDDLPF